MDLLGDRMLTTVSLLMAETRADVEWDIAKDLAIVTGVILVLVLLWAFYQAWRDTARQDAETVRRHDDAMRALSEREWNDDDW